MLSVTVLRRLAALSLVLVCACARTTDSTETGNPPVGVAGKVDVGFSVPLPNAKLAGVATRGAVAVTM